MSYEQQDMVVFADQTGNIYLISRETLEQGLVTDDHRKQEIQRILGLDDTSGYAVWPDFVVESNPEVLQQFRPLGGVTLAHVTE